MNNPQELVGKRKEAHEIIRSYQQMVYDKAIISFCDYRFQTAFLENLEDKFPKAQFSEYRSVDRFFGNGSFIICDVSEYSKHEKLDVLFSIQTFVDENDRSGDYECRLL